MKSAKPLYNSNLQDALHKALQEKSEQSPAQLAKARNTITERTAIIVQKVLPKNKGYILKLLPSGKEITRTLKHIYWLQANLALEFPFYYVALSRCRPSRRRTIRRTLCRSSSRG